MLKVQILGVITEIVSFTCKKGKARKLIKVEHSEPSLNRKQIVHCKCYRDNNHCSGTVSQLKIGDWVYVEGYPITKSTIESDGFSKSWLEVYITNIDLMRFTSANQLFLGAAHEGK